MSPKQDEIGIVVDPQYRRVTKEQSDKLEDVVVCFTDSWEYSAHSPGGVVI